MEFPLVANVSFVVVKPIFVDSVVRNGFVKFGVVNCSVVKFVSSSAVEVIGKTLK